MSEAIDTIKSVPLFSKFNENILKALDVSGHLTTYPPGSVLVEEGSIGDEIFLILEGRVRVTCKPTGDKKDTDIVFLDKGEIIGEMALIEAYPRSATVSAESEVQAKVWRASSWRALCEEYPQFGYQLVSGVAKILCERLRRTNESIAVLNSVLWGGDGN